MTLIVGLWICLPGRLTVVGAALCLLLTENSSWHTTLQRRQPYSPPPPNLLDSLLIRCPRSFFAASPFPWSSPPASTWPPHSNQTALPRPASRRSPQSLPLAPRAPCNAIRSPARQALSPAY